MNSFNLSNDVITNTGNSSQSNPWSHNSNTASRPMRAITKKQVISEAPSQPSVERRPILGIEKIHQPNQANQFPNSSRSKALSLESRSLHTSYSNDNQSVQTPDNISWREKIQRAHLANRNKLLNNQSGWPSVNNSNAIAALWKHEDTTVHISNIQSSQMTLSKRFDDLLPTMRQSYQRDSMNVFNLTKQPTSINSDPFKKSSFTPFHQNSNDFTTLTNQNALDIDTVNIPQCGPSFDKNFKSFFSPTYPTKKESPSLVNSSYPDFTRDSYYGSALPEERSIDDNTCSVLDLLSVKSNETSEQIDETDHPVDTFVNDYFPCQQYARQRKPLRIVDPSSNTEVVMPLDNDRGQSYHSASPLSDDLNQPDQQTSNTNSNADRLSEHKLVDWFGNSNSLIDSKSTVAPSSQPRERRRLQIFDPSSNQEVVVETRSNNPFPAEDAGPIDQKRTRKRLVIVDPVSNQEVTVINESTNAQAKKY